MYLFRSAQLTLVLLLGAILFPYYTYADCECYEYGDPENCSTEMSVYSYEGNDTIVFEINSLACAFDESDPGAGLRLTMIYGDGTSEQREVLYVFENSDPQSLGKVYWVHEFPDGISDEELEAMIAKSTVNIAPIYAPTGDIPGIERITSPDVNFNSLDDVADASIDFDAIYGFDPGTVADFDDVVDVLYPGDDPARFRGNSPQLGNQIAGMLENERAVPDFRFPLTIAFSNPCSSPLSGTFKFEFESDHLEFVDDDNENVTPFGEEIDYNENVDDGSFTVSFDDLPSGEVRSIVVYFDFISTELEDGDSLFFKFIPSPSNSSGCSGWDDEADIESEIEVFDSHDPNQILTPKYFSLYPSGHSKKDTLFFRVQFENVGRAEVTGISVEFEMEEKLEFICVKYMVLHERLLKYRPILTAVAHFFPINLLFNPPKYVPVQTSVSYTDVKQGDNPIASTVTKVIESDEPSEDLAQPPPSNQKYYVLRESNQKINVISKRGTLGAGSGKKLVATKVVDGMVIPLSMKENQGEIMILARMAEDFQVPPSDSLKVNGKVCFNIGLERRTQCLELDHTVSIKRAVSLPSLGIAPNETLGEKLYDYIFDECSQMVPQWILDIIATFLYVILPFILFRKPIFKAIIPIFKKGP